jgi:uncharacterized membrane protein YbaN (DUF454 family)
MPPSRDTKEFFTLKMWCNVSRFTRKYNFIYAHKQYGLSKRRFSEHLRLNTFIYTRLVQNYIEIWQ